MRVVVVMPGITPDAGAEKSFVATAPLVLEAGIELHLVLLTDRQTLVPELERLGVTVHDRSGRHGNLGRARAIRDVVSMLRPDVVHAVLVDATLPTQLAMIRRRTPVLVTWAATHQLDPDAECEVGAARWKLRVLRWGEILLGRATRTRYHAVTAGTAESYRRAVHAPPDRIMVAERGRPPGAFERPSDDAVSAVRAELGVADDQFLVLAVGRQEPQKGFDRLVRIAEDVRRMRPDVRFVVAGRPGRATPDLQRRLGDMAEPSVTFLGHRDDVPMLLHAADLVVCTSRREGAAGALIEAMAAARPIVSLPLAGLRDVLTDGIDAVVAPEADMAAAIAELADEPDRRARLGAAGRSTYEERFTADRAAASMLALYEWASGERSLTDSAPPAAARRETSGDPGSPSGAALGTPHG